MSTCTTNIRTIIGYVTRKQQNKVMLTLGHSRTLISNRTSILASFNICQQVLVTSGKNGCLNVFSCKLINLLTLEFSPFLRYHFIYCIILTLFMRGGMLPLFLSCLRIEHRPFLPSVLFCFVFLIKHKGFHLHIRRRLKT